MEEKTAMGVFVNRQNISVGEVTEKGRVVSSRQYMIQEKTQPAIMIQILKSLEDYENTIGWQHHPECMGAALRGVVNPYNGTWSEYDLVMSRKSAELRTMLEGRQGVPCAVENGVKAITVAEGALGRAAGCRNFIYLHLSYGVTCGKVIDGHLLHGNQNSNGEVGQVLVSGNYVCVERDVSILGMNHKMRRMADEYPHSPLRDRVENSADIVMPQELLRLYHQGDSLAVALLDDAALLHNLIWDSAPEMVVLGGEVGEVIYQSMATRLSSVVAARLPGGLVLTGLDPANAGLVGAAAIAFNMQQQFL